MVSLLIPGRWRIKPGHLDADFFTHTAEHDPRTPRLPPDACTGSKRSAHECRGSLHAAEQWRRASTEAVTAAAPVVAAATVSSGKSEGEAEDDDGDEGEGEGEVEGKREWEGRGEGD